MDVEGIVPADSLLEDEKDQIVKSIKDGQKIQCEVVEVKPEDKKVILTFVDVFFQPEVPAEEEASKTEEVKPEIEASSEGQEPENEPNDTEEKSESNEDTDSEETE